MLHRDDGETVRSTRNGATSSCSPATPICRSHGRATPPRHAAACTCTGARPSTSQARVHSRPGRRPAARRSPGLRRRAAEQSHTVPPTRAAQGVLAELPGRPTRASATTSRARDQEGRRVRQLRPARAALARRIMVAGPGEGERDGRRGRAAERARCPRSRSPSDAVAARDPATATTRSTAGGCRSAPVTPGASGRGLAPASHLQRALVLP